jgi:hypothetical protein
MCLEASLHAVKGQIFNVGSDDQNYQTCTERSERVAQLGHLIKELIPGVQVIHQGEDVDRRNSCTELGRSNRVSLAKTCARGLPGSPQEGHRPGLGAVQSLHHETENWPAGGVESNFRLTLPATPFNRR